MRGPRIVTPEEAEVYMAEEGQSNGDIYDLAHTVATEPGRIAAAERAAALKALAAVIALLGLSAAADPVWEYRERIKNGAEW